MVARCTLVVPDAGPLNSLWVADRLDLLLVLDMPVVVIDAVYDEVTSDPARYQKDRDVKAFIDARLGGDIRLETTFVGQQARLARAGGAYVPGAGIGDAAVAEFMSGPVARYLAHGEAVLLLFEDADVRNIHFIRQPDTLHLLSTVAMLRGLEEVGVIASADAILAAMLTPADPARGRYARRFAGLPHGTDIGAPAGSQWRPERMQG
jgi:hypothetical protein